MAFCWRSCTYQNICPAFFSFIFDFLQFHAKKEATGRGFAKSNYRWVRPNLHGEIMMKRLLHVTNFTARFALLCGFGLASLVPLYAQQSTE